MPLRNTSNGKDFSREMRENLTKFIRLVEHRLPEKVEVELERVILESFDKENYQDGKSSKWKDRKEVDPGRKLLIGKGSGRLKRSIEVTRNGRDIKATSDVEYAAVHNEGLKSGRGAGFTMPKRQFMPAPGEENPALDKAVEKWLDKEMDKIFR